MATETATAFFSYSRTDAPFALQLAKDLKASGVPVWIDQLDIPAGHPWDKAVEQALAASARVLVVLSPASVDSANVMDEVTFAIDEQKTLIPVLHRDCKIPLRLRRLQYVDFRADYDAAARELLRVMSAAGAPLSFAGRRRPRSLTTLLWSARILAVAALALSVALSNSMPAQKAGAPPAVAAVVLQTFAQAVACIWQKPGIVVSLLLAALAGAMIYSMRGLGDALEVLGIFVSPTLLFLLYRKLNRSYSLR